MQNIKTIVVALGGNAITRQDEKGTIFQQFVNTRTSLEGVSELIKMGHRVLITHGNGPQVGNELIRVEESKHLVPTLPLGILVADTQGGMGYMIEQCLQNLLHDRGITRQVTCIVTQTLVDKNDPALKNPTKFVGPYYHAEDVERLHESRGWILKKDAARGWRRVVPSPQPVQIIEKNIIRSLLDNDIAVIAAGGGGIPVYLEDNGWLEGVDAVIDKDLASAVMANNIGAEELMILTSVERVAIHFGTPEQQFLDHLTMDEATQYLREGHFPPGSMGPKIQAAINFLTSGGKKVIITSIEKSLEAIFGHTGTVISASGHSITE